MKSSYKKKKPKLDPEVIKEFMDARRACLKELNERLSKEDNK